MKRMKDFETKMYLTQNQYALSYLTNIKDLFEFCPSIKSLTIDADNYRTGSSEVLLTKINDLYIVEDQFYLPKLQSLAFELNLKVADLIIIKRCVRNNSSFLGNFFYRQLPMDSEETELDVTPESINEYIKQFEQEITNLRTDG